MRHLLLIPVLVSCGGDADDSATPGTGSTPITLPSRGTACLYGDGLPDDGEVKEQTAFGEGSVWARVVLDDCASGCARDVVATCDIRQVTGEVVVAAEASYTLPTGRVDCPAMCVEIVATCEGEPLAPGSWTLDYDGGHSDTVVVPGTAPTPCATSLRP